MKISHKKMRGFFILLVGNYVQGFRFPTSERISPTMGVIYPAIVVIYPAMLVVYPAMVQKPVKIMVISHFFNFHLPRIFAINVFLNSVSKHLGRKSYR